MAAGNNLKPLNLELHGGKVLSFQVDDETYRLAVDVADPATLQMLIASHNDVVGGESNDGVVNEDVAGTSTEADFEELCPSNVHTEPGAGASDAGSESSSWKHEQVLLLIALYTEYQGLFSSSVYKSFQVWKKIADRMVEKGHVYTGIQCDKKFRSLKYRYKTIVDANDQSGRGRRRWEFFEAMDQLMAGDPSVRPAAIVSSSKGLSSKPPLPTPSRPSKALEKSVTPSSGPLPTREPTPPPLNRLTTPPRPSSGRPTPPPPTPPPPTPPPEAEEVQTPLIKRRRRSETEPPVWFSSFMEDYRTQGARILSALEERNRLLARLIEIQSGNKAPT